MSKEQDGKLYGVKRQCLVAYAALYGSFLSGATTAWTGVALPQIRKEESFADVDEDSFSWITSILSIGMMVGALPTGIFADTFGRKATLMVSIPVVISGWLLVSFGTCVNHLLVGQFILGFCYSIYIIVGPAYVAETVEAKIRGMLVGAANLMVSVGMLFAYATGAILPWRQLTFVCACNPLMLCILLWIVPESPRFHVAKGKYVKALKSLAWLRGLPEDDIRIEEELKKIIDNLEGNSPEKKSIKSHVSELFELSTLKSIFIVVMLHAIRINAGPTVVKVYQADIFISTGVPVNEYMSAVIVAAVAVFGGIIFGPLVDFIGRRLTLYISYAVLTVSTVSIGVFYYFKKHDHDYVTTNYHWLPLTAFVVFWLGDSLGAGVPHSIAAELLPQRVRGSASSILRIFRGLSSFLAVRYFKTTQKAFGYDISYWILGSVSLVGILFVMFVVPETKGKTLEEIQTDISAKKDFKKLQKKSSKS